METTSECEIHSTTPNFFAFIFFSLGTNAWQRQDSQISMVSVISINSPERRTKRKERKKNNLKRKIISLTIAKRFIFNPVVICFAILDATINDTVYRRILQFPWCVEWLFSAFLSLSLSLSYLCVRPFPNKVSWVRTIREQSSRRHFNDLWLFVFHFILWFLKILNTMK